MIQELAPNAKIGVGHGQMGESDLEKTMLQFMRHEFDILVCTTIIENGLDIPLANTMLIENAERYGLSELYQLRGRVGRSNRRAYAYLLVPPDTELTEIARKRLAALKEFSEAILFAGQAAGNQVLVQIAHVHETPKLAFGSAPLPRRSASIQLGQRGSSG